MSGVQVLPLRPEQETEPLAQRRLEELRALSAEELRAEVERARRAKFPNERQLRRHFERHGEDLIADLDAYGALIAAIQANPGRVFSAYKPKGIQGQLLRWVFTRENILVVVGFFDSSEVVMTCHRAKMSQLAEGFISLEDYLKGRDDGKQMVEIKL